MFVHGRAPGPWLQPVPWIPSGPWPDPCIPNRPYSHVMNSPTLLTSFVVSQVLVTEYLRQLSAPEINAPIRQIRRVCPRKGDGRIRNSPPPCASRCGPRHLEHLRLDRILSRADIGGRTIRQSTAHQEWPLTDRAALRSKRPLLLRQRAYAKTEVVVRAVAAEIQLGKFRTIGIPLETIILAQSCQMGAARITSWLMNPSSGSVLEPSATGSLPGPVWAYSPR